MNKESIKNIAKENGSYAEDKIFEGEEFVSIFSEEVETGKDFRAWKQGIFVRKINQYWEIRFSQFGKTRQLEDKEIFELIKLWCRHPKDELFENYLE